MQPKHEAPNKLFLNFKTLSPVRAAAAAAAAVAAAAAAAVGR